MTLDGVVCFMNGPLYTRRSSPSDAVANRRIRASDGTVTPIAWTASRQPNNEASFCLQDWVLSSVPCTLKSSEYVTILVLRNSRTRPVWHSFFPSLAFSLLPSWQSETIAMPCRLPSGHVWSVWWLSKLRFGTRGNVLRWSSADVTSTR